MTATTRNAARRVTLGEDELACAEVARARATRLATIQHLRRKRTEYTTGGVGVTSPRVVPRARRSRRRFARVESMAFDKLDGRRFFPALLDTASSKDRAIGLRGLRSLLVHASTPA